MTEPLDRHAVGGLTFHLTPAEVWHRQANTDAYTPEAYPTDGFIHCTDGEANLLDVANRYYRADPRDYLVLDIDLSKVIAPVRYEDDNRIYPHIYGPLNPDAVVGIHRVKRDGNGAFVGVAGNG